MSLESVGEVQPREQGIARLGESFPLCDVPLKPWTGQSTQVSQSPIFYSPFSLEFAGSPNIDFNVLVEKPTDSDKGELWLEADMQQLGEAEKLTPEALSLLRRLRLRVSKQPGVEFTGEPDRVYLDMGKVVFSQFSRVGYRHRVNNIPVDSSDETLSQVNATFTLVEEAPHVASGGFQIRFPG